MSQASRFGVSFSLHRCSELDLDKKAVLKAAVKDLGFRRFRFMSYWNIHEQRQGNYNFRELDWQLDMVARYGGEVSLCLGKRQPRWPECHIPKWAARLPKEEWYQCLFKYIEVVVERYKDHPAISSWQLENEALLKSFGHCLDHDYNRDRLQKELELVKKLDTKHPVVMTLSDSWGLPLRKPKPDIFAMSLYRTTINSVGEKVQSSRSPRFYRLRASVIELLKRRPIFIHELQAEPWLDRAISKVPIQTQLKHMSPEAVAENLDFAAKIGLKPIDLWGLEWWYCLKQNGHTEIWEVVKDCLKKSMSGEELR